MKDLIIILEDRQIDEYNKINQNDNISILKVNELNINNYAELIDKSPCVLNSYKVYRWLLEQKELPEKIYFFDEGALGFFSIQAKKVLGTFKQTEFEILKIGKTIDRYKVSNEWSNGKAYDLKLSYMEQYCIDNEMNLEYSVEEPLVSVCISYFNHGKYLPETLDALVKNTYKNFEVIIIDSESTDSDSIEVFNKMKEKYKDRINFYHRQNESLGETRNHAVDMAKGEFIIFFDSDNIPEKNMIETYVRGMLISKCDCLTAHNLQFEDGMKDILFTPIGPALAYGIFENCFGDSAFCIKKDVFKNLGGFTIERLGLEDWEFLSKLSIEGYKQDVVPMPIYRYRRNNFSMANTVNNYQSHNRVMRSYFKNEPEYIRQLLAEFCIPVYKNGYKQYENLDETSNPVEGIYMGGVIVKVVKVIERLLPRKSYIYYFLKKIVKR